MISELFFARERAGFWHELLPMEEKFVREVNTLRTEQFARRVNSIVPHGDRDFVNELGFRIFKETASNHGLFAVLSLRDETMRALVEATRVDIEALRKDANRQFDPLVITAAHIGEARAIAQRLRKCFALEIIAGSLTFAPTFPGCGLVDEACGDIYTDEMLVEVKAGDRTFRATDLRQLLVYCALNQAASYFTITRLAMINPRHGAKAIFALEECCLQMAGEAAVDVLAAIIHEISSVEASI